MFNSNKYQFRHVGRGEHKEFTAIRNFLKASDLGIDISIDVFITVWYDERMVACGGIAGNIIKCVAISPELRGAGIALKLATELVHLAYERGHSHLFLYTKTSNETLFRDCGFFPIVDVPGTVVLMENSCCRLNRYVQQLESLRRPGNTIGCIVMNANPFTLGHQYLVEQAAARCDWLHLMLVREDASAFSYEDRLAMAQAGTQHITNLTLHAGSEYLISRATFPCYFIKDQSIINHCHTEIDLKIFRHYIAPALGITHRFVGEEPFCQLTARYNRDMYHWLQTPELRFPPVEVVEISRKTCGGEPISASRVRKLLARHDMAAIAELVPPGSLQRLQQLQALRTSRHATSRPVLSGES
ncbi:[citrate (pro-3S)-lyase] ligase [Entomohabitans teleogrylli]|uniref:[citrate (pro-3S)-lyase] ligase n=1 Tax=Entomohabitans teleogrylli TaxID=1384589 RepID=UPI00073D8368|nr:[citrate (pro-3S)-lyase] ligase [Entomohabitans teleogrylli]